MSYTNNLATLCVRNTIPLHMKLDLLSHGLRFDLIVQSTEEPKERRPSVWVRWTTLRPVQHLEILYGLNDVAV